MMHQTLDRATGVDETLACPRQWSRPDKMNSPLLKIPRIFHWIWLGPHPLPRAHALWREGWLAKHPDWRAMVWTDSNLPPLINAPEFAEAQNFAQAADILRYEIVWRYGGVYVDTDMECLQNVEELLHGIDAFAGWLEPNEICNCIFGATAKHTWLKDIIAGLPAAMASGFGILHQTGPRFFTKMTCGRHDVVVFPKSRVYRLDGASTAEESYCVHHAAKSWHAHQQRATEQKLRTIAQLEIDPRIPPGEAFIRVDDDLGIERYSARRSISFRAPDGEILGCPATDADAVARLESLRKQGVRFFAVIGPSSWWLDFYQALDVHLKRHATCHVRNDGLALFELEASPLSETNSPHRRKEQP